jgi:hypothetical protein
MAEESIISNKELFKIVIERLRVKKVWQALKSRGLTWFVFFTVLGVIAIAPLVLTGRFLSQGNWSFQERISLLANLSQIFLSIGVLVAVQQANGAKEELRIKLRREAGAIAFSQAEKFAEIIKEISTLDQKIKDIKDEKGNPLGFKLRPIELEIFNGEEIKKQTLDVQVYFNSAILVLKSNKDIRDDLGRLLNKLEAFAMYFNHGSADEEAVFSSLSGVYCDFVEKAAVYLCASRDQSTYTFGNVVSLYRTWSQRLKKLLQPKYKNMIDKLCMSGKWGEARSIEHLIDGI